ncbi:MAG: NADH-quinone oxidoreductase subunit NuoG [Acidimicrobiia bacterium]|nr:NADH-quinone oxidoreductase subunit NuoG [Acidimicrobiia bacterium]
MTDVKREVAVDTVSLTVNGAAVEAHKGQLVIDAADNAGIHIPRFCYHPRMKSVGMCRMCIVDIDTGRGPALQPACMIPVADGMVVDTLSESTKKAQDGVLEFLLINHPLDCPVCDKGGECPLQDNAYAFGPGESRFVEEKRHFEKPIPVSDLVLLDRERCILCDRCTRFARDVAGDAFIVFQERGGQTEVNTFPEHPFASYFSGNTVQICPVGALTAGPYRFRARPWDVEKDESTCTSCSFGCRITVEASRDEVIRRQGVDLDPVNWGWMCDKGRFDFDAMNASERLRTPLVRDGAAAREATWSEAIGRAADALRPALDGGADRVAVLGGARLTNEAAYTWAKLAKGVLGTDNVDCQLADGLPPEVVFGLPRATIDDACADGGTVLLLAPDIKEEVPVLFLRLRDAVLAHGVKVVELTPQSTSMTPLAAASLRYRPGEAAVVARLLGGGDGGGLSIDGDVSAARELLRGATRLTIVLGRPSIGESAATIVDAVGALLGGFPDAHVLTVLRRANVHGALDMGLTPGLLPGHVTIDAGRDWFTEAWGRVPAATGLDATGILAAAAEGKIDTLVLLGADPIADFPDHQLARTALDTVGTVIAVDVLPNASTALAHVVLPAAGPSEEAGTTTNLEGRVLTVAQKVTPAGTARADWHIAAELAFRLGHDLGLESIGGIWDEIERLAPSYAGLTVDIVRRAADRDGALMPIDEAQLAELDGARVTIASQRHRVDAGSATAANRAAAAESQEERQADELAAEAEQSDDEGKGVARGASTSQARPPLLSFAPPATATELPAVDAYGLRLVVSRTLYDNGTLNQHSPSIAGLARVACLRLNPADLARLGLDATATVEVSSVRGSLTLDAVADDRIPPGSAGIYTNHEGADPADLLDVHAPVTTIHIGTKS